MKKRTMSRRFVFERLEDRRLLAADCAMQALPETEAMAPCHCEVASANYPAEDLSAQEFVAGEVPDTAHVSQALPAAEITVAATESETEVVDSGMATSPAVDPRVLDLADTMDGYFGTINAENPTETLEFTAAGDGIVDVVIASSFGDAHPVISVANSAGDVIQPKAVGLEGFDMLTLEVQDGETYQLSISSDDASCIGSGSGHFQVTVGFEAHVDQHADQMGCKSTELELVDNTAELSGRIESAGDIDTFRFTATDDGQVTLELHETVDNARIGLGVSVYDSEGNSLAEGSTNQMLQISFDVDSGQEYFVSLAAGEGQKGTYQFGLELKTSPELPVVDNADCGIADQTIDLNAAQPDDVVADAEATNAVDSANLAVDEVPAPVCPPVVNAGESESEIAAEPNGQLPTGAIAAAVTADLPTGDQQSENGLVDSIEVPSNDPLSGAWVNCNNDEAIAAGDDLDAGAALALISSEDESIVDAGAVLVDSQLDIDRPTVDLAEQDSCG